MARMNNFFINALFIYLIFTSAVPAYSACVKMPDGTEVCDDGTPVGALNDRLKAIHRTLSVDVPLDDIKNLEAAGKVEKGREEYKWQEIVTGSFDTYAATIHFLNDPDDDIRVTHIVSNGSVIGVSLYRSDFDPPPRYVLRSKFEELTEGPSYKTILKTYTPIPNHCEDVSEWRDRRVVIYYDFYIVYQNILNKLCGDSPGKWLKHELIIVVKNGHE